MHKTLIIIFIALKAALFAQPSISWQMGLGGTASDKATTLSATPDGGLITAGYTNSTNGDISGNHGNFDFWVIKTDSLGEIQWKQTYGGANGEWPYAIANCSDGGYILAGFTSSNDQNVSGNHGDLDAWVLKLSSLGIIQWQKCFGGSGHEEAWSIRQTQDDGFIFAGRATSTDGDLTQNKGGYDYWVVKLDKHGTLEWQKTLGGSKEDTATSIRQTADGSYIVLGESHSIDGDLQIGVHGDGDYWIVKLDSAGNIMWEKALGGSYWDRPSEVINTSDGGYLLAGYASSGNGDMSAHYGGLDAWLVKIDPGGNLEWEKNYGGSNDDWAFSLQQRLDGHFIIAGATLSNDIDISGNKGYADLWIFEVDPDGKMTWSKTFGGTRNEYAYSCNVDSTNAIRVAGSSSSSDGDVATNHGQTDFWIVKLNPTSSPTQEIPSGELNIFPNPTQNTAQIQLPTQARPIALRLFDTFGKEVLHWADFPENGILDLEHLPTGLYWAQVIDLEGNRFSGKILKL